MKLRTLMNATPVSGDVDRSDATSCAGGKRRAAQATGHRAAAAFLPILLVGIAFVDVLATPPGQTLAPPTNLRLAGGDEEPTFSGGILENVVNATQRFRPSESEILQFLPSRGEFTFPAPYDTVGIRFTNSSDCAGADCVAHVGYSYWRRINNHVDDAEFMIFITLVGQGGPTLFSYHKTAGTVTKVGPMFDVGSSYRQALDELWYFSATKPHAVYLNNTAGTQLLRFDVITKEFELVFDIRSTKAMAAVGNNRTIWQYHSSNDDRVHSATVVSSQGAYLGCVAYLEDTDSYQYYPTPGAGIDECQIDKSGRWLMTKEWIVSAGLDNRIIELETELIRLIADPDGATGHSDLGFGYMIGDDNWNALPGAQRFWDFEGSLDGVPLMFHNDDWDVAIPDHISHLNATSALPPEEQYACGSGASVRQSIHANEIICYGLNGSLDVLVVAPVMTDMNAAGGGDSYSKLPKGNLDISGRYFAWTSNMGGNRLDLFVVKVPGHLLAP